MIKAAYADRETVIDILTQSFQDNKSVNYIVKQDSRRVERIKVLMGYSFDLCMLFGSVYLSDNKKACTLTLLPERKKISLKTILLDAKLAVFAVGLLHVKKALDRETQIKKVYPTPAEQINYLWFIGVDPEYQNKGIGGQLLREVVKTSSRIVYLETSMPENIHWYEKHGFEVYQTLSFPHGPLFMLRTKSK